MIPQALGQLVLGVALVGFGFLVIARFGAGGLAPHTRPIAGDRKASQGPQVRPPQGVDGAVGVGYVEPKRLGSAVPLAVAMQPNFDVFFEAFQAVVAAGGVVVVVLVVVLTIRRFTTF